MSRAFTTTLGYLDAGGSTLPAALERAAAQVEIDPEHAVAQQIAGAMRAALVLDKGQRVRAAESTAALQTLFQRIAGALAQHNPEIDIFGSAESLSDTVRRALATPSASGSPVLGMPSAPANPFGSPREIIARSTRRGGTVVLNADDLVAPQLRGRPFAAAQQIYRALKPAANTARDAAFAAALREAPTPANRTVILTAGGPGSGKSTLIAAAPPGALVFDTILGNAPAARRWLGAVRESRRMSVVQYVHRDFAQAVRANLSRALEANRLATARQIAQAHFDARIAVEDLLATDAHRSDVCVELYHNRGADGYAPLSAAALRALPQPSLDPLAAQAYALADAIYHGQDPDWRGPSLPAEIYDAFLEGEGGGGQRGPSGGSQPPGGGGGALRRPAQPAAAGQLGAPSLGRPGAAPATLAMSLTGQDAGTSRRSKA